ncbi:hypothetical protein NC652_020018 [Populus alba x Populus x berolinensis]|nr:hypothetical protein NC652_020018 [Populus alba x Populus x berolinensis]
MWACVCVYTSRIIRTIFSLTSPCMLFICNSFPIKAYTGRFFKLSSTCIN